MDREADALKRETEILRELVLTLAKLTPNARVRVVAYLMLACGDTATFDRTLRELAAKHGGQA